MPHASHGVQSRLTARSLACYGKVQCLSGKIVLVIRAAVDALYAPRDSVDDPLQASIGDDTEAVANPDAVPACLHQSRSSKDGKMPGCLRLRDPEAYVNVADAHLPCAQEVQDPQSRLVAQRSQQPLKCREFGRHLNHPVRHVYRAPRRSVEIAKVSSSWPLARATPARALAYAASAATSADRAWATSRWY